MSKEPIVLVTGAASGIGCATARAFAACGMHLVLLDKNEHALNALARQLREAGAQVSAIVIDLAVIPNIWQGVQTALEPFGGRVDILISNVGVVLSAPFAEIALEQWHQSFEVNFFSHIALLQVVIPKMRAQGSGSIVLTGSDQGLQPDANLSAYAAAKAALHNLVKTLSRELAPANISINAVAPGMTRTPLVEQLMEGYAREFGTDPNTAAYLELQRRGVIHGRLADPEEIAEAIVYLAQANFCRGTILNISGGNVRC